MELKSFKDIFQTTPYKNHVHFKIICQLGTRKKKISVMKPAFIGSWASSCSRIYYSGLLVEVEFQMYI